MPKDFAITIQNGNPFPPKDWKSPEKDSIKNCGVDLTEYFAYQLLEEALALFSRDEIDSLQLQGKLKSSVQLTEHMGQTLPIFKDYSKFETRGNQIDAQLREGNCYFYPDGGSVFADYKYMRDRANLRAGGYSKPNITAEEYAQIWNKNPAIQIAWSKGARILDGMFNKDMTTDEALQQAKDIVEKYWW